MPEHRKTYTTYDREQAQQARREELDELYVKLDQGLRSLRQSGNYVKYLRIMSRFHEYSFRNSLLIMQQFPQAQLIGSYSAWKQAGRQVRKGEHGIRILAPITYKAKRDVPVVDESTGLYERTSNGSVVTEKKEVRVAGFRAISVFDISQTDGSDMPEIAAELTGEVKDYDILFRAVTAAAGVPVTTGKLADGTYGVCEVEERRIVLREGLSQAQSIKTLLHEAAHCRMHPPGNKYTRAVREVQAESMAFVVSAHFGLDTSEYSFGYLDTWSRDMTDDELRECVDVVSRHSSTFISEIEKELERIREKEIVPAGTER